MDRDSDREPDERDFSSRDAEFDPGNDVESCSNTTDVEPEPSKYGKRIALRTPTPVSSGTV